MRRWMDGDYWREIVLVSLFGTRFLVLPPHHPHPPTPLCLSLTTHTLPLPSASPLATLCVAHVGYCSSYPQTLRLSSLFHLRFLSLIPLQTGRQVKEGRGMGSKARRRMAPEERGNGGTTQRWRERKGHRQRIECARDRKQKEHKRRGRRTDGQTTRTPTLLTPRRVASSPASQPFWVDSHHIQPGVEADLMYLLHSSLRQLSLSLADAQAILSPLLL
ncbi:hypothetical protein BLNAU_9950 [Blattamonas nauphoetae]|uniref:Uncharacterized protein n=1 Tax=Blattamonas nauphoetae TaxID=2049346 RepID=A0ABQ9XU72_9EUKA|nr:hypothetical protein BLNAU_9950 [Blattamonas nauphoetae]